MQRVKVRSTGSNPPANLVCFVHNLMVFFLLPRLLLPALIVPLDLTTGKSTVRSSQKMCGRAHCTVHTTVPIRRNLTGNACQNAFCFRSARVPVPVLYPFCSRSHTRSVSVPFLFPFVFPVRFLLIGTVFTLSKWRKSLKDSTTTTGGQQPWSSS